jgi:trehalose 6-phosphate phosphatase
MWTFSWSSGRTSSGARPAGSPLDRFRRKADRTGIFLDFDGTLAEIVARPDQARLVAGAAEVLPRLVERVQIVAVISGRPGAQVRELVSVGGVRIVGLYGLSEDEEGRQSVLGARTEVERAAKRVSGAWVEDKGASLTVHYRAAPDPSGAQALLVPALQDIAGRHNMSLFLGKKVVEVAGGDIPGKGAVVTALVREGSLDGCLYAGDDWPDFEAFRALDTLRAAGMDTLKVAVRSEETPEELLAAADVVVERPAGVVRLLAQL